LAALIVYTVFSVLQWAQIRWTNRLTREALNGSDSALKQTLEKLQSQINQMSRLADNAGKQADVGTATLKLERPWIGPAWRAVLYLPNGEPDGVDWRFRNGGRSPAIHVFIHLELKLVPTPLKIEALKSPPKIPKCQRNAPVNSGHTVLVPNVDTDTTVQFTPEIMASFADIVARRKTVFLVGCIDYSDTSGKPGYRTNVTEYYVPPGPNPASEERYGEFRIDNVGNDAY
jgi:hypothetical protein